MWTKRFIIFRDNHINTLTKKNMKYWSVEEVFESIFYSFQYRILKYLLNLRNNVDMAFEFCFEIYN